MRTLALILCAVSIGAQAADFNWEALIYPQDGTAIGYYSGEKLYRRGRDAVTIGYVAAVYDTDLQSPKGRTYCVPDAVTTGQITDVAWRFLEQNPELRHLSAAHLVRQSLIRAWPCRP